MVRTMNIDDYDEVSRLWHKIKGFSIRSIDDSREGVERFLQRNPDTSVVAVEDSKIVGAILCGMTADAAVCTMFVWIRNTGCGESANPWWFLP